MAKTGNSRRVHELLRSKYLEPARRNHAKTVRVVAGEVARELGLMMRVPLYQGRTRISMLRKRMRESCSPVWICKPIWPSVYLAGL